VQGQALTLDFKSVLMQFADCDPNHECSPLSGSEHADEGVYAAALAVQSGHGVGLHSPQSHAVQNSRQDVAAAAGLASVNNASNSAAAAADKVKEIDLDTFSNVYGVVYSRKKEHPNPDPSTVPFEWVLPVQADLLHSSHNAKQGTIELRIGEYTVRINIDLWSKKTKDSRGKNLSLLQLRYSQGGKVLCTVHLATCPGGPCPLASANETTYHLVVHSFESVAPRLRVKCWLHRAWVQDIAHCDIHDATLTLPKEFQIPGSPPGPVKIVGSFVAPKAPKAPITSAAAAAVDLSPAGRSAQLSRKRPSDLQLDASNEDTASPPPSDVTATVGIAGAASRANCAASSSGDHTSPLQPYLEAKVSLPVHVLLELQKRWESCCTPDEVLSGWIYACLQTVHAQADISLMRVEADWGYQLSNLDGDFAKRFASLISHDCARGDGGPHWRSMPSIRVETWCLNAAGALNLPSPRAHIPPCAAAVTSSSAPRDAQASLLPLQCSQCTYTYMKQLLQLICCPEPVPDHPDLRVGWLPIYRFYCWLQPQSTSDPGASDVLNWLLEHMFTPEHPDGSLPDGSLRLRAGFEHLVRTLWWTRATTAKHLPLLALSKSGPANSWILRFCEGNPSHKLLDGTSVIDQPVVRQLVLVYWAAKCGLCEQLLPLQLPSSGAQSTGGPLLSEESLRELAALKGRPINEVLDKLELDFKHIRADDTHMHPKCDYRPVPMAAAPAASTAAATTPAVETSSCPSCASGGSGAASMVQVKSPSSNPADLTSGFAALSFETKYRKTTVVRKRQPNK